MSRSHTIDQVVLGTDSVDDFIRSFMSSLIIATKESQQNTVNSEEGVEKIKNLLAQLLNFAEPNENFNLSDDMSDDYIYDQLVAVIDILLDSADNDLDEFRDGITLQTKIKQSLNLDKDRILTSRVVDMEKPQFKFAHDICNERTIPFMPRVTTKYHASTALDLKEIRYPEGSREEDAIMPRTYFAHPYEQEIRKLKYTSWQLADASNLQVFIPQSSQRRFKFLDTAAEFEILLIDLSNNQHEIAIDLEHHSYRSFQGFTCLMQISTREADFVLDTLSLRSSLPELLRVFADPNIVKVFHGCESDILWLQKDFGLYIVNCFDTYHAAKLLQYPALSFAHLCKLHCGVSLNKKYQLSDWRRRPLPTEMLEYARYDTMYLLPIYDCMRREVWRAHGEEGITAVLDATRHVCLKRYDIEPFYPLRYRKLVDISNRKLAAKLSETQDMCLAALYDWRDATARARDESVLFVMSNAELMRIAAAMPRSVSELEKCQPLSATVLASAQEIVDTLQSKLSLRAGSSLPGATTTGGGGGGKGQVASAKAKTPADMLMPVYDTKSSSHPHPHNNLSNPHVSILSFVPSTPKRPSDVDRRQHGEVSASPVLSANEIFRLAGWSTPLPADARELTPSPNMTEALTAFQQHHKAVGDADRLQATRAQVLHSMLGKGLAFNESRSTAPPADDIRSIAAAPAMVGSGSQPLVDDGQEPLLEVPRSLAEIYEISNRNRGRGKEKKRNRDGTEDGSCMITAATAAAGVGMMTGTSSIGGMDARNSDVRHEAGMTSAALDATDYFKDSATPIEKGTEATVDLFETMGWVRSSEKSAVLEAFRNEQKGQEAHGNEADDSRVGINKGPKGANSPPRGNIGSGSGGAPRDSPMRSSKGSTANRSVPTAATTGVDTEAFDYSKYSSAGVGAWRPNSSSGSTGGVGVQPQQQGAFNPFIHGASNVRGKSHKQQGESNSRSTNQPEKRDTERTHTYASKK